MKFVRLGQGGRIALTLLRDDVEQNWFVLPLQKLKGLNEQRNIMPVDRSIITESKILKNDAWQNKVLNALFDLVNKLLCESATDHFHELGGLFVQMAVGIVGYQLVQIVGDGTHIFRDRPFVVVQDNDKPFGTVGDVVQG